jgi:hypothetical protein
MMSTRPAHVDHGGTAAAIGHVEHLDAGDVLEQLARQMRRAAVARRGKRQLAGIGLGMVDDLLHRFHRMFGVDRHDQRQLGDEDDRRKILHRVIRQAHVEVRPDTVGGDGIEQQRVAVGLRLGDVVRGDGAGCAAAVADDDRLAECIGKLAANEAGDEIGRATGRHRHHQRDDPAGVAVLRVGG